MTLTLVYASSILDLIASMWPGSFGTQIEVGCKIIHEIIFLGGPGLRADSINQDPRQGLQTMGLQLLRQKVYNQIFPKETHSPAHG